MPDGSDGSRFLDRADDTDGVDDGVQQAITAPILALGAGLAMLVEGIFSGFTRLTEVLGDARELLGSFLTEGITVLSAGADASAASVADFGLVGFPLGVIVVGVGVLIADALFDSIPLLDAVLPWR